MQNDPPDPLPRRPSAYSPGGGCGGNGTDGGTVVDSGGWRVEMGKDTSISWTHHTYNPWWGCTKVSHGCTNCYADTFAKRTGHDIWGPKAERRFFGEKHWQDPIKWNRDAERDGERRRVFCASMADVFERHMVDSINDRMDEARMQLWDVIAQTPMLDWLLLTKRPENIGDMIPWADGRAQHAWKADVSQWSNVWLGTSTENQEELETRTPFLLMVPAAVHFLSAEPLLGPLDFEMDTEIGVLSFLKSHDISDEPTNKIDWVITGGESGNGARPCDPDWVRSIRDQCLAAGVAYHHKQWGGRIAKSNGRTLDGKIWDEFPAPLVTI